MNRTTVPFPPEAIGSIIGKGGAKIKSIKQESGVSVCKIEKGKSEVSLTGTIQQISTAKKLIAEVVNNHIKVYAHPEKAYNIIESSKLYDKTIVKFKTFTGTTDDMNVKKTFYVPSFITKDSETKKFNVDQIKIAEEKRNFFQKEEKNRILKEVTSIVMKESKQSKFNSFGFSIGSTTFYESKKRFKETIDLPTFMNSKIGHKEDFKCKYQAVVDESSFEKIKKFLINNNFSVQQNHWCSIHFVEKEKQQRCNLIIEFLKDDKYDVSCFTNKTMHFFINFLQQPNLKFDYRLFYHTTEKYDIERDDIKKIIEFTKKTKNVTSSDLESLGLKNLSFSSIRDQQSNLFSNDEYKIFVNKVFMDDINFRLEIQIFNKEIEELKKDQESLSDDDVLKRVLEMEGFVKDLLIFISK
eukprot:gene8228-53_t